MPVPDALFVFTEISYKMHFIIVFNRVKHKEFVIAYNMKYDFSSAINMAESLRAMKYSVGSVEQ